MPARSAIAAAAPAVPVAAVQLALAAAPQLQLPGRAPVALAATDAWLLAWLAIEGPTPREQLARLLWPDSTEQAARNALRQRLFRLRRQAGLELVHGGATLALAECARHDLAQAGTLLAPLAPPPGDALGLWLAQQRLQRREAALDRLARALADAEARGDLGAALDAARRQLAIDPLREPAHAALIRLHYLGGDRAAALAAYDACARRLRAELGVGPGPEVLALHALLQGGATPAAPPRGLPPALSRPPRMVGRQAELHQLLGVVATGARVWIEAPAGQGKTRLLQAVVEQRPDALLLAARPGDEAVPYATLARWIATLHARGPAPAAVRAALAWLEPPEADTDPAPAPVGAGTRPTLRLAHTIRALHAWLWRADDARTAVALDDLHCADPATLELLPALLEATAQADGVSAPCGGAWLLATRPVADDSAVATLRATLARAAPLQRIVPAPLDDAALADLLHALALPGLDGAGVAAALRDRSGGNPLYALETLKQAWALGGAWAAGAEAALPAPGNLQALLALQLQALSAAAMQLARVAAIAGADFDVALAAQVLHQPALALTDAWAELEARQVLQGPAFAHDLLREAVRAGVPEALARHVHAEVAQWLQSRHGEPARIAQHLQAAAQDLAALPWLREAAARAHAALREPERVAFLLRGADICEAHQRSAAAFELLSLALQSHMNTTREAAGLPLLDRLERLARSPREQAEAAGHRSWYGTALGDWASAIAHGRRALELLGAPAAADEALHATLSQRLGTALAMAGRFDEALPALQAARPWCDAHAGSNAAAEYLGNLAAVLDNLGRPAQARPCHEQVIATTHALGDAAFEATARANLAVSRLNAGDVPGARAQLEQARALSAGYERQGASAGFIAALQAQVDRADGRYAAALACCDEARQLLEQANPAWLPVVHMHRAQIWLDLHQLARARQALDAVDAAALAPRLRARHAWLLARWHQALGRPCAAAYAQALAWAPAQGWPELRWLLHVECAHQGGGEAGLHQLDALVDQACSAGHQAVALCARLRWLDLLSRWPGADAARQRLPTCLVRRARAHLRGVTDAVDGADPGVAVQPWGLYHAEIWLAPARALLRLGRADAARALAGTGWAWVQQVGRTHVAAPWRDTFWHAHPVNAALRHLASHDPAASGS